MRSYRELIAWVFFLVLPTFLFSQIAFWDDGSSYTSGNANVSGSAASFTGLSGTTNFFSCNGNAVSPSGWSTGGFNASEYIEYTITIDPGFTANVTGFSMYTRRSSSGPSSWVLRSSADGYASNLASGSRGTSCSMTSSSFSVSATSSITFRLYGFGASSSGGNARIGDFTINGTVTAAASPPVINSSLTANANCGEAFSYFITATNGPTSFSASGLPAGLGINTSTGEISGTPTSTGVSNITIGATNGSGSDSETLVLTTNASVSFNVTSVSVNENDGSYSISVESGCTGAHTVDIVVTGGSATGGSEYTYSTVTASFAGSTTFSTNLTLNDNGSCDGNTDVTFGFNNFSGAVLAGDDSTLAVTIADDEQSSGLALAEQDFEGGGWSYTTNGDGPNASYGNTGNGIRIGGNNENITLNTISVSGSSNMLLTIKTASVGGIENADALEIFVDLDGGGFPVTPDITIQESNPSDGAFNRSWAYSASGVASTTAGTPASFTGDGLTGYATVEITIPDGTSTVSVRINAENNNSTENYYIDDISLTGDACLSCSEPTSQPTLNLGAVTTITANLNWAAGDGSGRLTVVSTSPISDTPVDGTTYAANSVYASGDQIGTNQYVVNASSSGSVSVSNLMPGTQYYASNFEYDCNPGSEDYLISGAPTIDFVTRPNDANSFTETCIRNTEIDLSWSAPVGSFDGYLLVVRQGATPNAVTSLDPSSQAFDTNYSIAPTYGAGPSNVVYRGTGTSATITGLSNASSYTFELFTYKIGVSDYQYCVEQFTTGFGDYTLNTGQIPRLNAVSQVEYWDIEALFASGIDTTWDDVRVRLYCSNDNALCNTYFGQDSLRVAHYIAGSSHWTLEATPHAEGTDGSWRYVESTDFFRSLSPFTFGVEDISTTLPVELVDFKAFLTTESTVRLEWITAVEINNDGFEIQRSIDGQSFETIGCVYGLGNSTVTIVSDFSDPLPYIGQSYYRLKQIDFDGTVAYSNLEVIEIEEVRDLEVSVYPNPSTNGQLFIQFENEIEEEISYKAYDMLGFKMLSGKFEQGSNKRSFTIDISQLASGNFLLVLNNDKKIKFSVK